MNRFGNVGIFVQIVIRLINFNRNLDSSLSWRNKIVVADDYIRLIFKFQKRKMRENIGTESRRSHLKNMRLCMSEENYIDTSAFHGYVDDVCNYV